jgi:hypothetical protein
LHSDFGILAYLSLTLGRPFDLSEQGPKAAGVTKSRMAANQIAVADSSRDSQKRKLQSRQEINTPQSLNRCRSKT